MHIVFFHPRIDTDSKTPEILFNKIREIREIRGLFLYAPPITDPLLAHPTLHIPLPFCLFRFL